MPEICIHAEKASPKAVAHHSSRAAFLVSISAFNLFKFSAAPA